ATVPPMPSTSSAIHTASYSTSRLTAGTAPGADRREKGKNGSGGSGIFLRPPRCRKFSTTIRRYSTDYSARHAPFPCHLSAGRWLRHHLHPRVKSRRKGCFLLR